MGWLLLAPLAVGMLANSCDKEEEEMPIENTAWKSYGLAERPWAEAKGATPANDAVPFPEEVDISWEEFLKGTLPGGKESEGVALVMSESVFLRVMQGLTMEFYSDNDAKAIFNVMIYEDFFAKKNGKMLTVEFPCKYYKENGWIAVRDYNYDDLGNMLSPKYAEFLKLNQEDFVLVFKAIAGLIVIQSELIASHYMGMPFEYMNGKYIISPRIETSVILADQNKTDAAVAYTIGKLMEYVPCSKEKAVQIMMQIGLMMQKDSYCLYLKKVE